jgi:hypothetical protein
VTSARDRAERLLAETELFDELGLHELAAEARMVARGVLELTAAVEIERSARVAIQERHEHLLARLGDRS